MRQKYNAKPTRGIYSQLAKEYGLTDVMARRIVLGLDWEDPKYHPIVPEFRHGNIPRTTKGENHPMAKLTRIQVDEIREKYATGLWTFTTLGYQYKVSRVMISRIVRDLNWT